MIHNDPLEYHFSQILVYHDLSKRNDRKCKQTMNRSAIQVAHRKTVSFCLMIDSKVLTDPKHRMIKNSLKIDKNIILSKLVLCVNLISSSLPTTTNSAITTSDYVHDIEIAKDLIDF